METTFFIGDSRQTRFVALTDKDAHPNIPQGTMSTVVAYNLLNVLTEWMGRDEQADAREVYKQELKVLCAIVDLDPEFAEKFKLHWTPEALVQRIPRSSAG